MKNKTISKTIKRAQRPVTRISITKKDVGRNNRNSLDKLKSVIKFIEEDIVTDLRDTMASYIPTKDEDLERELHFAIDVDELEDTMSDLKALHAQLVRMNRNYR